MKSVLTHQTSADTLIVPFEGESFPAFLTLSERESLRLSNALHAEHTIIELQRDDYCVVMVQLAGNQESSRERGVQLFKCLEEKKISAADVRMEAGSAEQFFAMLEGLMLASYQYLELFSKTDKKANKLQEIRLMIPEELHDGYREMEELVRAVHVTRDLVNRPHSHQSASLFMEQIREQVCPLGVSMEVLEKKQIESLAMGGLLGVNKGSLDPPAFGILTWKPQDALNVKPIVLVGKGIVYDTGGLSLKPTANSMDVMKSDMAGAAAVAGAVMAAAANNLPVHIIGLIPATDNRPGGNAVAPGDVITMFNKTTVEVMNTDAEGRLILGDALAFAQKYDPELVIDLATLTGAAMRAIGTYGIAVMGNTGAHIKALSQSGEAVYERLVELPLWKEYRKELDSDIADLKNLGGANAGAQTAGKFLEHFTAYPWVHLDIAGPAFLDSASHYRPKGATGSGVRLLYHFLKHYKQWQPNE